MEQKNAFPIRYIVGICFLLAAFAVLLIEGIAYVYIDFLLILFPVPMWLSLLCFMGAALCFLPPDWTGLWVGSAALVLFHFLFQQERPGLLFEIRSDVPSVDGAWNAVCYITAFGCFLYLCGVVGIMIGGDGPSAPQTMRHKVLILAGWVAFGLSCCFPNPAVTLGRWEGPILYLGPVLYVAFCWAQYFLIHWLFFASLAWIISIFANRRQQNKV